MSAVQVTWLVSAMQLLLLALVWWLVGWRVRRPRQTLHDMAAFDAVLACGLLLVATREWLPYWLGHAAANLLLLGATLLLWRGLARALALREAPPPTVPVVGAMGLIAVLGADPELARWRAAVLLLVLAGLTGALARACRHATAQHLGPGIARLMSGLCGLLAAALGLRALAGLWLGTPLAADAPGWHTLVLALLAVAVLTTVNALAASAVLLGALQRLKRRAQIDELTGLANRQGLDRALSQAWSRWQREHRRFGVVALRLAELDDMQARHGEAAADDVLRRAAAVISHELRQTDLLALRRGREMVAVVDGQPAAEDLARLARRLGTAVANMRLLPAWPDLRLSLDSGVALVGAGDTQPDGVARRALEALRAPAHEAVVQSAA